MAICLLGGAIGARSASGTTRFVQTPGIRRGLRVATEFHGFSVFYAGDEVDGYRLQAVLAAVTNPPLGAFGFTYAACAQRRCAAGFDVSSYPICIDNQRTEPFTRRLNLNVRGAPAGEFMLTPTVVGLVIYTGTTAVTITASDEGRGALDAIEGIARKMYAINGAVGDGKLAPATRTAIAGSSRCAK